MNNEDVTARIANNVLTINKVSLDINIEATFEVIPPTIYSLTIKSTGNGTVSYDDNVIRSNSSSFSVVEGASFSIVLIPDEGYRVKSVVVNSVDVTTAVVNNQYAINRISKNTSIEVAFEAITYSLSIKATGNGSATYNGSTIRNNTTLFTITHGSSATVSFTSDNGYRIRSVKLNNTDVTPSVANSRYTINKMNADASLEVEFEVIPPTVYALNVVTSGNGSVSYEGSTIRNQSRSYSKTEGSTITLTISPDNGYRVAFVKVNNKDVTSQIMDGKLAVSISSNTSIEVVFEAIPVITYTFSITAKGNGVASYDGTAVRGESSSYTIAEGENVTITFTPDTGYRIKSVKQNGADVTSKVANSQFTINIATNTTLEVEFEIITYSLSIKVTGNGSVTYNSTEVRNKTTSFVVNHGSFAVVSLFPDAGNRVKNVKLNGTDVIENVSNNQYTISNITASITLEVEFEVIPPTIYDMNIVVSGNGNVTYNEIVIRNQSRDYSVTEGSSITLAFSSDTGYRVAFVKVNNSDVTSQISNGELTISNVLSDLNVEVVFEEIPPTTYVLTIMASGNGAASYDGTSVRNGSYAFTVVEGAYAAVAFTPDNGHHVLAVRLNGIDVTGSAYNNQYTISKITRNTTLDVEFAKDITDLAKDGINYKVVSYGEQTVNLATGDYGQVLTVPGTFTVDDKEWRVVGVDANALAGNVRLAAILWNAEAPFNGSVDNPNLLLYVKSQEYAPSGMQNVIVDGTAEEIVLTDAANGNDFYCPKAFMAKRVTYEHNYSMLTGHGTCLGWETLVLPFDVTQVSRQSVELVPYDTWTRGSSQRPFWLYSLSEVGWKAETSIAANTPYIISMPNNENYNPTYNVSGNILFTGTNVQVRASDNLTTGRNGNKKLVANYQNLPASSDIYALNVSNLWSQNTDVSQANGSTFIRALRTVHPFEAYLAVEGSAALAPHYIPLFDNGVPTDIKGICNLPIDDLPIYDLQGRKIENSKSVNRKLPYGIYIVNGQKVVVP